MTAQFLLTAAHYTDPSWLPLERQRIFRRTWQYAGDASVLAQPNTVLVTTVAGCSVLITRTPTGDLKGFHNVCPHRASALLAPGVHSLNRLICPYHAWVYNLAGDLVGLPAESQFSEFCRADYPLPTVQVDIWAGFLFVCLEGNAPPLHEFLAPIPAKIQGYRQLTTQQFSQKRDRVACNWKKFHDNTLCDYYVAIAHWQTLHPMQGPVQRHQHGFDLYVNWLHTPTTPQWRSENSVLESVGDREGFYTFGIFPNLHLLAMPNGLLAWLRIDPIDTQHCEVIAEIYGIPDFCPSSAVLAAELEAFQREDRVLTEGVQRGYASSAYCPGLMNQLEARIVHQQQLILEFLGQASMGIAPIGMNEPDSL